MQQQRPPVQREMSNVSYDSGTLWNGKVTSVLGSEASALFRAVDINGDNRVTRDEFVTGITHAPNVDLFDVEAGRLFDSIDIEGVGFVDNDQFIEVNTLYITTILLIINITHSNFSFLS